MPRRSDKQIREVLAAELAQLEREEAEAALSRADSYRATFLSRTLRATSPDRRQQVRSWLDSGICDDGLLYHVTRRENIPAIQQHGLQPNQPASYAGFEDWSRGKVFFAAGEDALEHWQMLFLTSQRLHRPLRLADMVVLRLRPNSPVYRRIYPDDEANHECSFFTLHAIPPKELEVMASTLDPASPDEWIPLGTRRARAKSNPLRRPLPSFEVFVIPWGNASAVGIRDGRDAIGGLTVFPTSDGRGQVVAAAAVRGYGPMLYDTAATLLRLPLVPSNERSPDALRFWSRAGGTVEPMTAAAWQAKYGMPLANLVISPPAPGTRAFEALRDVIFEAEDVADEAEQKRLGAPIKRTPMMSRERRELLARARRPTVDVPVAKRGRAKKNRARRNPSASALPLFISVLAHLRALQWLYWTTHWTAAGPNFYGMHLMLQRLYEGKKGGPDINEEIDQLGERIVAYFGARAISPADLQQQSAELIRAAQDSNPIVSLLRLEAGLQTAIRAAWDAEQQAGVERSLGIDDYLMGLANERDTARYLLGRMRPGVGRAT